MIHKTDIFAALTICGAALALAVAAGRSKHAVQSPSDGNFPEGRVIRVSPEVVTTKGTYTTDNLTKFDLPAEDSNSPASKYTYSNTVLKKDESGWTSETEMTFNGNTACKLTIKVGKDAVQAGTFSAGAWNEHQCENTDDGILETE